MKANNGLDRRDLSPDRPVAQWTPKLLCLRSTRSIRNTNTLMVKYGLLLLGCAGLLSATTINVNSIQPATGAGYQQDQYGEYIGPYQLNTSIGPLQIMCIDLQYGVNPPFTAYVTPVSNIPTSPQTTYLADQTIYEQETYLFSLIVNAPNLTTQAEIQDAAWALNDSSFYQTLVSTNNTQSLASLSYYNQVANMSAGSLAPAFDYSKYDVISNTAGAGSNTQEFIYLDPTAATPEPASVGLMGFSLLGFGLLIKSANRNNLSRKTSEL
jgi:PEP-CTERM motif